MSLFDSQQCDSRNIACFGDPRACGKNKLKFFHFSACNLQLLLGANTHWWPPSSWDLFPEADVECRGQQGWLSWKCQHIILQVFSQQDRQSFMTSMPGTILKTELQISSWGCLCYLLCDLVPWNLQIRQTFIKNVGSAALAYYLDLPQRCPVSCLVPCLTSPLESVAFLFPFSHLLESLLP